MRPTKVPLPWRRTISPVPPTQSALDNLSVEFVGLVAFLIGGILLDRLWPFAVAAVGRDLVRDSGLADLQFGLFDAPTLLVAQMLTLSPIRCHHDLLCLSLDCHP